MVAVRSYTNAATLSLLCVAALCSGCGAPGARGVESVAESRHELSSTPAQVQIEEANAQAPSDEPDWRTCSDYGDSKPVEELKKAWARFTQGGRFRLGRKEGFAFAWGDLNFPRFAATYDHMAAIVVDTSRADDKRFGLVIFSAPAREKGAYRAYWLYRAADLSRASVARASGELYVTEQLDDGPHSCSVNWDTRRGRYVCR